MKEKTVSILEFYASPPSTAEPGSFFGLLKQLWLNHRRRRRMQRALMALGEMDAHLLRDIGIEPLDVYDALNSRRRQSVLFYPIRRNDHE